MPRKVKDVDGRDEHGHDDVERSWPNKAWYHMRITLVLDDDLVARAQALTGVKEKTLLVREALKALIERESARRLARLGGSEPALKAPRRRPKAK